MIDEIQSSLQQLRVECDLLSDNDFILIKNEVISKIDNLDNRIVGKILCDIIFDIEKKKNSLYI